MPQLLNLDVLAMGEFDIKAVIFKLSISYFCSLKLVAILLLSAL